MLPMGTIMTTCMLLGVIFCQRLPVIGAHKWAPRGLIRSVGVVLCAAGLWNTFWYALRHLGEFWGHMALISGLLMLALSVGLLTGDRTASRRRAMAEQIMVILLAACMGVYAWTIYHL